jgi:hypothetical protein
MIRFSCSRCGSAIEVPEEQGGITIHCSRCGNPTSVPTLVAVESGRVHSRIAPGLAWQSWLRGFPFVPWRRQGSPALLLLALVLFPLPWVQIQCDKPLGNSGSKTVAEQSGFQAAYGGYSENPVVLEARFEDERKAIQAKTLEKDGARLWSGWMVLYPILLLGGIAAGLLIRKVWLRSALLLCCTLGVGFVLLMQTRVGFPLEQAVPRAGPKQVSIGDMIKVETSSIPGFEIHYTGWFWLAATAVLGALVVACADAWPAIRLSHSSRFPSIG